MKGRIDSEGYLHRDGKNLYCPFTPLTRKGQDVRCGDWCSHFGMTTKYIDRIEIFLDNSPRLIETRLEDNGKTSIEICHGKLLIFDDFTDERTK